MYWRARQDSSAPHPAATATAQPTAGPTTQIDPPPDLTANPLPWFYGHV